MDKYDRQAREESEVKATREGYWVRIKAGSIVVGLFPSATEARDAIAEWRTARARKLRRFAAAARQARKESRITTRPPHYWLSVYADGGDGTEGGWMSIGPYPTLRAAWPDLRAWREKRAAGLRAEGDEDGR